jgi:predicted dehydrogenase
MKKMLPILLGLTGLVLNTFAGDAKPPVYFAIVGLAHDHAMGFIPRVQKQSDLQLAGIVETNQDLIARYSQRFNLAPGLFYPSLDALFAHTNIQAVATFTSIYDHQSVVETCAAHGVDVMMEKPLATDMKQARAIQKAAQRSGIQVIVNYETSWYPGNWAAYQIVHDGHQIGDIRKIVVHDGHRGPKEIGCSTNFLAWLTDPVLNGGGALNDFGCYGADLATWFFDGQRPTSVFAVTKQIKPDIYPKVEDDAVVVLNYPKAEVILEPSWNWAYDRKDMEIYGQSGYVLIPQPNLIRVRSPQTHDEKEITPDPLTAPYTDPVSYFTAVVRHEIKPTGLASLDVNVTVVEILDAAHQSARTGRAVTLP